MDIESTSENDTTCLTLTGEVTIYGAAELKQALQEAVAAKRAVQVNLAGVTELDTAGFQQLYLAKREASRHDQTFHLVDHSEVTREVLDIFGMGAFFGDPVVIRAAQSPDGAPERPKKTRRPRK